MHELTLCFIASCNTLSSTDDIAFCRCAALDTFEAMLLSGCQPHAAVYSSIIDVLWQTGITWAQVKALSLFNSAVG